MLPQSAACQIVGVALNCGQMCLLRSRANGGATVSLAKPAADRLVWALAESPPAAEGPEALAPLQAKPVAMNLVVECMDCAR